VISSRLHHVWIAGILFISAIASCTTDSYSASKTIPGGAVEIRTIAPEDSLVLRLDDDTPPLTNQIQYHAGSGENELVSILNKYSGNIIFFDYSSGEESYRLDYSNFVEGNQITGYLVADSLFLYAYNEQVLYVLEKDARSALDKISFSSDTRDRRKAPPAPYVATNSPVISSQSCLLMTGFLSYEPGDANLDSRPVAMLYDKRDKTMSYAVEYPEVYRQGNWGGGFCYRRPYHTVNDRNQVLISFAASDSLTVFDPDSGETKNVLSRSALIGKITPFHKNKHGVPNSVKEMSWYMKTPSYENIVFDDYANRYYRFFRLPDAEYSGKPGNNKRIGVIVMDRNLSFLDEYLLPETRYLLENTIATPHGLMIQKYSKNEKGMLFDIFKFP